jgi:hypothetical protein
MNYFWLAPKDQRLNNWILHVESDDGVRLRDRYAGLACSRCRKLDELQALSLGIDADVRIRSRSNFLQTDDGFVCMSADLWQYLTDHALSGASGIAIPGDERYTLVIPEGEDHVDPDRSGMEFRRACGMCGRTGETCLFPALEAMDLPEDPFALICPSVPMENRSCRQFWFLAAAPLVNLFKKQRVRGVEFMKAR